MTRYLGVDLHRNCFTVCTLTEKGRNYHRRWEMKSLEKFARSLRQDDEVAVEVTGNTKLFHDAVSPYVKKVVVVNSQQFKVISKSVNKTDKNDARLLALFLSKAILPEVRMKGKEQSQLASLTQTRDKLVKSRTALKNKINNILSAQGINLKKESLSSDKGLREVLGMVVDPLVNVELRVLVEQIRSMNKGIGELEKAIKQEGPTHPARCL